MRGCQQAAAGRAHVHDAVVGARVQAVVKQVSRSVRLSARLPCSTSASSVAAAGSNTRGMQHAGT